MDFLSPELTSQLIALGQVVLMDLVLAGDNAVAVGLAAAALPQDQRRKAILAGLAIAVVLRIAFALITIQLLAIIGLLMAGGFLLLWVCWKMWRELREQSANDEEAQKQLELAARIEHGDGPTPEELGIKRKTFGAALVQIIIADVAMSLDNVLAVAGAAHEHPWVMVFGLVLSIALMGVAATFIAKLLHKYSWIGYVGLVVVLYVALNMIWNGGRDIVVRTGNTANFNAKVPAFLAISDEEAAKHMKKSGDAPEPEVVAAPTVADLTVPPEMEPAA